jgi:hypothetical protein
MHDDVMQKTFLLLALFVATTAQAEARRLGETRAVSDIAGVKRLPHCAFDGTHDVYLVARGLNPTGAAFLD